ncbi:hypothetical protein DFH11DRAFT_1723230 [Phellopilus nigrolimitatus]|nr:hypothetical protein DFH11DRAFT_1723230 [Phellopilus nigrolimitatus]
MDDFPIASPVEAPPAYEFSQHELDQKLAATTQRPRTSADQERRQQDPSGEGCWEVWDEATHRANAIRVSESSANSDERHASASSTSSVRPLNIRKKARRKQVTSEAAKEQPSWFKDAQLGAAADSSSVSGQAMAPHSMPSEQQRGVPVVVHHAVPEEPEDDRSIPPPPFAPIDNSIDGPAYERYARDLQQRRTSNPTVVLRYNGEDLAASPPPSPPQSPVIPYATPGLNLRHRAASPRIGTNSGAYHHAEYLAPQQTQSRTPSPHPMSPPSTRQPRYVPPVPRMEFDPSVAYEATKSVYGQLPTETLHRNQGAVALYNSAVVPHLTAQTSRQTATTNVKRYTSSITSLPEYDQPGQEQAQQNKTPAQQLYASQNLSASRASFYPQSPLNPVPQYHQVAQYPQ